MAESRATARGWLAGLLLTTVFTAWLPLAAAESLGIVQDGVRCLDNPDQSYALYLPSTYSPDRAWPIVFCFDPGARGSEPVERLHAAAERFGFIVLGSNNSHNSSWEICAAAADAMIRDARRRFTLDERRVYAAGLSGGARVSCDVAARWGFAGVFVAGAGFPESSVPEKVPFAFYGCVGIEDFNYGEMRRTEAKLAEMNVPQRLRIHPGGHEWFPVSLTADALGWFELQAMRSGRRARDPVLIGTLYRERMDRLRTLGATAEAHFEGAAITADFAGLTDTTEPAAIAARLRDSDAVRRFYKDEKKAAEREKRLFERLAEAAVHPDEPRPPAPYADSAAGQRGTRDVFAGPEERNDDPFARDQSHEPWPSREASTFAPPPPVDPYAKIRATADAIRRQGRTDIAARRAISCFAGMLSERGLADERVGAERTALQAFELSAVVASEKPNTQFLIARACARLGERAKAREALRAARSLGFPYANLLAEVETTLKP